VAGENSKGGALGVQRRIRPHWWAVLAVAVSLLALVAATSGRPKTSVGLAAAPGPSAHRQSGPTTTAPPSTSTTTTGPQPGPSTVTPATSSTVSGSGSTVVTHVLARQSTPPTPTTTTPTTATTGGGSVAAAVQAVVPVPFRGELQQPDDASASYVFSGSGAMQVSASSTLAVPLLLTVTCTAGAVQQAGSSLVSVVVPNADGPCNVVLKETVVQYVAVPYIITVRPEGG
jgi:hypothetical protein